MSCLNNLNRNVTTRCRRYGRVLKQSTGDKGTNCLLINLALHSAVHKHFHLINLILFTKSSL